LILRILYYNNYMEEIQNSSLEENGTSEPEAEKPIPVVFSIIFGFMLLLILFLTVGIILIIANDTSSIQPEPDPQPSVHTVSTEPDTEPDTEPETSNTADTEQTETPAPSDSHQEDTGKKPEKLIQAIQEAAKAIEQKHYKKSFAITEQALKQYGDDIKLKNLHEKARIHLMDGYRALLEQGEALAQADNIEDARTVYTELASAIIPDIAEQAGKKIKELDRIVQQRKQAKIENKAKKLYLNCSFYFNDFMDAEDKQKKKEAAEEALTHISRLQTDYAESEFVKRKADILKTMRGLLKEKKP